jgi:hypothetical protein
MANTFIENRDAWLRMSDIDYVGQFVKSWLAFNAWYRSAYAESHDRKIMDELKWQGNPVLNRLRPMLEEESDEAEQLRADIGLLHDRLERYEIHVGKNKDKKRLTLRNVFLKERPPVKRFRSYYGYNFVVERLANKEVTIAVTKQKGAVAVLTHKQLSYDLESLEALHQYQNNLTPNLRACLKQLYAEAAPNWIENLSTFWDTDTNSRELKCGAFLFNCGKEALFAGVIEAIYQMRCTLFHGELVPTKDAVLCYEPAYRLVRRFLECVG